MSPQHLLTVIDIYSKWTPSTKSGAVSKGFLLPKGPLLKEQLGSTELEDHHIRSCRPSPKWAGDQLKRASVVSFEPVCSKSLLCLLRTTPRMYSMEQQRYHHHALRNQVCACDYHQYCHHRHHDYIIATKKTTMVRFDILGQVVHGSWASTIERA